MNFFCAKQQDIGIYCDAPCGFCNKAKTITPESPAPVQSITVRNISEDFAKTVENNHKDPDTFYTVSSEQPNGDEIAVIHKSEKFVTIEDAKKLMYWTAQMVKGLIDSGKSSSDINENIESKCNNFNH